MKNKEIAVLFESMAEMMELLEENIFRVNSYRKAARAIEGLSEDVEKVCKEERLTEIAGIGESMAQKIEEYCRTGKIARYEELASKLPPKLPELMALPGLGPKTAAKLWKEANITCVEDLKACLEKDREKLESIAGLGEKKVDQLAKSLLLVESAGGRLRLGDAVEIAQGLIAHARKVKAVARVEAAGSVRRGRETVGDIDLLCEAPEAQGSKIVEHFCKAPQVHRVLAQGPTKGSVLLAHNVQADLRVVEARSFGAALAYFTGSKDHNIRLRERAIKRGMKLNEYGLYRAEHQVAGANEEEIYQHLGLPWIAPELREDQGEIEAALEGKLPELVQLSQVRGDFQMHTQASDGLATIDEMIEACSRLGYRAMAITDHSQSQHQAGGLTARALKAHLRAIRKAASKYPDMLVLASCEVDILKDGSLDFEPDVLADLDFVLVSPHAALSMTGPAATDRLVRAIRSGLAHCVGHPTGRIINGRPGLEIDIDAVARAAAEHHVALEVNADPARLDLRDSHVRSALAAGAKVMINTDAHSVPSLGLMSFGVRTARRGWATAGDIINCWSPQAIQDWLKLPRK